MAVTLHLPDEAHTQILAQRLAAILLPAGSARLHLHGELGSGKTTFARALLRACGVKGRIKSPSYALLESYKVSNLYFHHLDFYRFNKHQDWEDAGFREILQTQALILIEWPEQAGSLLPAPDLTLNLAYQETSDTGRQARLTAYSTQGHAWLVTLKTSLGNSGTSGLT